MKQCALAPTSMSKSIKIPAGPAPVLISNKQVDALYETFEAVTEALQTLGVEYIVTGGSLLGTIRQHSLLFCDDDIDIAVIDYSYCSHQKDQRNEIAYDKVSTQLQSKLGKEYSYTIKPWEGGDKVRPKRMSNIFLDIFVLREYTTLDDLLQVIGIKANGQPQQQSYIDGILDKIQKAAFSQGEMDSLFPLWHFNTRKAIEMWPKEVYRPKELFPIERNHKFGPLTNISAPRMPILLLKRAFGSDCFHVYYQSASHQKQKKEEDKTKLEAKNHESVGELKPLVLDGGTWETATKTELSDLQYLPVQPISRAKRRFTLHGKEQLFQYIDFQTERETKWQRECTSNAKKVSTASGSQRPRKTIYMDGVFDLFHIGHLNAIQECAKLGDRVIIGVTGQEDATGYKRLPIIKEDERVAIISSLKYVDKVICPCPLIVTQKFMEEEQIDLVVHGFASKEDEKRQYEFFEIPIKNGKFKTIPYYQDLSTTDIISKIKTMSLE